VAAERNGRWGKAIKMPGPGALNAGESGVNSVSCASAGNCAAGGWYTDSRGSQGFVAAERDGRWGTAIEVPGLGALNTDAGFAATDSVSCSSAGNCVAGGYYNAHHPRSSQQGFVAAEVDGRWRTATGLPGLQALNVGRAAEVTSLSCSSAGTCAATGYYFDGTGNGHSQEFVASQENGRWGTAIEVPGLGALNKGHQVTELPVVSCAPAGTCAAGGFYTDASGHAQGFVVSRTR
jgi:hypothetical protein